MGNNHGAIKLNIFQYCDSKFGLFSIAPCKLLLFFSSILECSSKVIALTTIAIAIIIALRTDSEKISTTFRYCL